MPYKTVGAGWDKDNGSISIKIDGIELNATLWPNTRKTADKQPDWNISVREEVAEELGLGKKKDEITQFNKEVEREINPEDIPF